MLNKRLPAQARQSLLESHIEDGRKDQPPDEEPAHSQGTSEHDSEGDSNNMNEVDSGQQSADHEEIDGIQYNIFHVTNAGDLYLRYTNSLAAKKGGKAKISLQVHTKSHEGGSTSCNQ